ncbi:hypothetical protein PFISCL1PPCAC_23551, partial [Pristionchus fissidentatus]
RRRDFTRAGVARPSRASAAYLPDCVAASMIAREGASRVGARLYGTGSAAFAGSGSGFSGYGSSTASPMMSRWPSTASLASSCAYCNCDVQGGHPLAVAVMHQSHVDYSVTKGGARTWIVLLVFGLLCTSLYSLVQMEEGGGRSIA